MTTMPKMRVMRDEELDRPEQLECRLNMLRASLATAGNKPGNKPSRSAILRRIGLLRQRIGPSGTVSPPVPAVLLLSKAEVDDWGDRRRPAM